MISYFKTNINQQIYENFESVFYEAIRWKYIREVKIFHYKLNENFEKKLLTTIPHCTYKNILKINCFMSQHPYKDAEHCEKNCIWITAAGKSINIEDMNVIHIKNTLKALQASANGEIIPLGWCGNRNAWIDIFKNVLKTKK